MTTTPEAPRRLARSRWRRLDAAQLAAANDAAGREGRQRWPERHSGEMGMVEALLDRAIHGEPGAPGAGASDEAVALAEMLLLHPDDEAVHGAYVKTMVPGVLYHHGTDPGGEPRWRAAWDRVVDARLAEADAEGVWLTPALHALVALGHALAAEGPGAGRLDPRLVERQDQAVRAMREVRDARQLREISRLPGWAVAMARWSPRPLPPALAAHLLVELGAEWEEEGGLPGDMAEMREVVPLLVACACGSPRGRRALRGWLMSERSPLPGVMRAHVTAQLHAAGVGLDATERALVRARWVATQRPPGSEHGALIALAHDARVVRHGRWGRRLLAMTAAPEVAAAHRDDIARGLVLTATGPIWARAALGLVEAGRGARLAELLDLGVAARATEIEAADRARLLARGGREVREQLLRWSGREAEERCAVERGAERPRRSR